MKTSDYIVKYLIAKGITDVFGYPGGMVTHLMDSFSKYQGQIKAHVTYNEQGAAMAACGYAQIRGKTGVAYATSGPGATNLITGICNAYMDSIPTLFITGQVNSFEQKGSLKVRQRGFQETDIVSMVEPITKYAIQVNDAKQIKYELDKAFYIANEGRKGPVLLDIAMDVTRTDINPEELLGYICESKPLERINFSDIETVIKHAKRPVLLLGNGIDRDNKCWKEKLKEIGIPVVTSMISVDTQEGLDNCYGFIGAYGDRTANFIVAKSDVVIAVGARLDVRQVGAKRENFAPNSKIIRVDIDKAELEYKVHEDEVGINADANSFLNGLVNIWPKKDYSEWIAICDEIKDKLLGLDERKYNKLVRAISKYIPAKSIVTTDVGQNQVWVAQSFGLKENQRVLFSGGHGAMGYSLPASIGAALASNSTVYSFNGDGGIQMNIQELQMIARENLPVKIIIFNNNALGMIRHFQEMYFDKNYFQTTLNGGFTSPNFEKLAEAYSLDYVCAESEAEVDALAEVFTNSKPTIIEIKINEETYVFPKLEFGKPNQDQEPLIDRELYMYLMSLGDNMKEEQKYVGGVQRLNVSLIVSVPYYATSCIYAEVA